MGVCWLSTRGTLGCRIKIHDLTIWFWCLYLDTSISVPRSWAGCVLASRRWVEAKTSCVEVLEVQRMPKGTTSRLWGGKPFRPYRGPPCIPPLYQPMARGGKPLCGGLPLDAPWIAACALLVGLLVSSRLVLYARDRQRGGCFRCCLLVFVWLLCTKRRGGPLIAWWDGCHARILGSLVELCPPVIGPDYSPSNVIDVDENNCLILSTCQVPSPKVFVGSIHEAPWNVPSFI